MAKTERKERSQALYETILKLKDLDECRKFFEDLCTPTELQSMEQRFDVAVYLQQGLVYLDILEKTGASSATISRVRRVHAGRRRRRCGTGHHHPGRPGQKRLNQEESREDYETTDVGQRGCCPWTV